MLAVTERGGEKRESFKQFRDENAAANQAGHWGFSVCSAARAEMARKMALRETPGVLCPGAVPRAAQFLSDTWRWLGERVALVRP